MKDGDKVNLDTTTEVSSEFLAEIQSQFELASREDGFAGKVARADETRFAIWDGQSEDGRKHEGQLGTPPFPFEGAADVRVRLTDDICQHLLDGYMLSWSRGSLSIEGSSMQSETLGSIRMYLNNLIYGEMHTELMHELELHANHTLDYGWGMLHFAWDRRISLRPKRLTLEMLREFPEFAELTQEILGESQDYYINYLRGEHSLSAAEAKSMVADLVAKGATEIPVKEVTRNRPCVTALRPYRDVLFPPDVSDIQRARVIFRREFLSEAELRATAATSGWDTDWVEEAVEKGKGKSYRPQDLEVRSGSYDFWDSKARAEQIEVVWAYHRGVTEDGISAIYMTVYCPAFTQFEGSGQKSPAYAEFDIVTGAGDTYPFAVHRYENVRRGIIESRGVPELTRTWEYEIASQINATIDRSTFDTFPPFEVPPEYGDQLVIEPGALLTTYNRGDLGFIDPPKREPSNAFNLIQALEVRVDRYFGRENKLVPVDITIKRTQRIIGSWLAHLQEVIRLIWEQSRLFESDERYAQVVQIPEATVPRDDYSPAITVDFDVKSMNSEMVLKTLEAIATTLIPLDSSGVIDRGELTRIALKHIDPALARQVTTSDKQASSKIFEEVRSETSMMFLGNEPMLKEEEPAAAMKLQALEAVVGGNPLYQKALQDPEARFAELYGKYRQHLEFQVQQHQVNPQIGRTGVAPGAPAPPAGTP